MPGRGPHSPNSPKDQRYAVRGSGCEAYEAYRHADPENGGGFGHVHSLPKPRSLRAKPGTAPTFIHAERRSARPPHRSRCTPNRRSEGHNGRRMATHYDSWMKGTDLGTNRSAYGWIDPPLANLPGRISTNWTIRQHTWSRGMNESPLVTARDRCFPLLLARQWHENYLCDPQVAA